METILIIIWTTWKWFLTLKKIYNCSNVENKLKTVNKTNETADEPEYVGEVVDPREQAGDEQQHGDGDQLEQGSHRVGEQLPALDDFHEQTRQYAEYASRRTHLFTRVSNNE